VVLIYQSIFLALGQVWANKMRSLLTTLGIIIGVASVTSVIAALTGLKQHILTQMESFAPTGMFIMPRQPDDGHHHRWQELRFHPRDFDGLLEHCPSVSGMCRVCEAFLTVSVGPHSKA